MTSSRASAGKHQAPRVVTDDLVRQALSFIPPDIERDTWVRIGMAIKDELGDAAFDLWNHWSAGGQTYNERDARDAWRSFKPGGKTKIGTLFDIAKKHGFRFPEADAVQTPAQVAAVGAEAQRLGEERQRKRSIEAAEYTRRADQAVLDAYALWEKASDSGSSPYLSAKQVKGHGLRFMEDGTALVPARDAAGMLKNIQRLFPAKDADGKWPKRHLPGGRKSGLWHLIGSTDGAAVVLVAEGFCTAASLHEATGYPAVVAFDTSNLVHVAKALRQLLPTALLLMCGDDDQAVLERTGKNPGRDAATAAARAAKTDTGQAGAVFPAGMAGGGNDFNDMVVQLGADAVRAIVEAAVASPAIPKPQRAPKSAAGGGNDGPPLLPPHNDRSGDEGGSGVTENDPFILVTKEEQVSARDSRCDRPGVWFLQKNPDGSAKWPLWVCAPLHVTARTRTDDGNGWGMLLEFTDPDGRAKAWAMPSALLSGEGSEWAGRLRDMGLRMAPGTAPRTRLAQYLDTRELSERVTCTETTGWHGGVYVQPTSCIGESAAGKRYIFQTDGGIEDTFSQAGSLPDWNCEVAAPCAGNSRLVFALCCAFGGPLMGLLGVQTGGFHLVGDSSLGKTTALLVASSVWGSPRFKQQWRSTANALESTAAQRNHSLLVLDEIGQAEGRLVGEAVYMISNEQEKARSTRSNLLRKKRTWRLMFLSSGEKGLADYMHEAGCKVNEGQLLRMPSVPADAGASMGMLEELHGAVDGKAFVETITKACATHYGEVGRSWLCWLAQHLAEVEARADSIMKRFEAECMPAGANSQVMRVAARFALVAAAGELATKAGLTGWDIGESVRSVRSCFDAWLAKRGHTGNGERHAAAVQIKSFLERNGDALFTAMHRMTDDHRANTPLRVGFRRAVDEHGEPVKLDAAQEYVDKRSAADMQAMGGSQWQYLCLPETFKREVCKGLDWLQAAQLLRDRGHLQTEGDRLTVRQRIPGMPKTSVFLIKPSIFSDDFEDL
jgi:putative DNA primase/helicase